MKKNFLILSIVVTAMIFTSCAAIQSKNHKPKSELVSAESKSDFLSAESKSDFLSAELKLYPDPHKIPVIAGEEIVFKITVKPNGKNIQNIKIYFGDNENPKECPLKYENEEYLPIATPHSYMKNGIYYPYIQYDGESKKISFKNKIIICKEKFKTDEELKEEAFREMADKVAEYINIVCKKFKSNSEKSVEDKKPKFTFSSFKDANFEYSKDQSDMELIQKLIKHIVKKENKEYIMLERSPQTLIRLAHESIVRIKEKFPNKKPLEDERDFGEHLPEMEYGLTTEYVDPYKPFFYGIKIEGVQDRRTKTNSEGEKNSNESEEKNSNEVDKSTIKKEQETKSVSDRPLLYAKFDTADFLIVIDRIIYPPVIKNNDERLYYNTDYDEEMVDRKAKVKIGIRIFDREKKGEIESIKDIDEDIEGEASQKIFRNYFQQENEKPQDIAKNDRTPKPTNINHPKNEKPESVLEKLIEMKKIFDSPKINAFIDAVIGKD